MKRSAIDVAADVEVITRGDLPEGLSEYARNKIIKIGEVVGQPILHARIRLTRQADPAVACPVLAQANLDVNGRPARAQAAGVTGHQAVDLLAHRLRNRMVGLAGHWESLRGGRPADEPHEWRHSSEPAHRPPYYPRPAAERQIIRHKSFTSPQITPGQAARQMDRMDYDFHLFTEAGTGADAVVYRGGPTGYRLARVAVPGWLSLQELPMTLSPLPAPVLTVAQARARLELTGWPFVFFADAATKRGNLLYHRYDGHYGLITPAS